MYKIETKNMCFEIEENASDAFFALPKNTLKGGGFWRLILDDGLRTEIPIFSHKQNGEVKRNSDGSITVTYSSLLSEYGDSYDIVFKIEIKKEGELISFTPTLENNSDVRINECFCPIMPFDGIMGKREEDVLYMPQGLGTRVVDPTRKLESLTKQYYSHNEYETFWHLHYPQASMCWMGIESQDKFLYISRRDPDIRCCFLTVRHTIHENDLMLSIVHMPMANEGEKITYAPTVVGLLDGDFRSGADDYRRFAEKAFYRPVQKQEWVKNMTGFQRVIMRSQYGEDYYKAEDLPSLYLEGAKYGIHTLFLFAWWKEGMDKNYPEYNEPYEGAYKALKENIEKVQSMGGRVILEMNCHFLDPITDYYKKFGEELTIKNIFGEEIRKAFVYPGYGEFNVTHGGRAFPLCCSCTEKWRAQLMSQMKLMNSFSADCLFADCYGAAPTQPCFDSRHEHGKRVDEDWKGKRKFFQSAAEYCKEEGKVLGAEITTDIAASYAEFIHGLINIDLEPKSDQFPALFRYTFPEVITTNRGVRCSEGNYEKQLKTTFLYGLRYDAELFVCRRGLDSDKKYASVIKECTDWMEEYRDFFFDGKFICRELSPIPHALKRAEYEAKDGRYLTVLYNTGKDPIDAYSRTIAPNEMVFIVK